MVKHDEIYSAAQLTALIHEVGFLPLLDSGIRALLPDASDKQLQRLIG